MGFRLVAEKSQWKSCVNRRAIVSLRSPEASGRGQGRKRKKPKPFASALFLLGQYNCRYTIEPKRQGVKPGIFPGVLNYFIANALSTAANAGFGS